MVSTMKVTGPDGVDHEYVEDELPAIELAKELARTAPGAPVTVTGTARDGTAVNATLRWTPNDGVIYVDHLDHVT